MKEPYVRYFIETCEWWVCQDSRMICNKLSGPWRDKHLAEKALVTIKTKGA